jgi:HD-like signal output (HDOD) protein
MPDCLNLAAEQILESSGDLPALPEAACHIMAVIEDPRTTATKLEKALALDQTLTAKVLRIANSPFYGAVREIKTVSEAIVRLGFVTIRNWTLVTATKSVFLAPGSGLLFQKIWRQSVLSAMASQLVAQAVRLHEPETVFIGGLMQNIGQLVLARSEPELFQQILEISAQRGLPYYEVEQQLLGFDHGALGALLIRDWNLSRDLEEAVRWHHRLEDEAAQNRRLGAMIALGEEVAACSGSGEAVEADATEDPDSAPARYLGITAQTYGRLREQARELSIDPTLFG